VLQEPETLRLSIKDQPSRS